MEKRIKSRVNKALNEKLFPGCVVGAVKGENKLVLPFGRFTYEKGSRETQKESIFDVASVTKSIPTASLALKLIEDGKLKLDDKVIKYIPEINNSYRQDVLIKHLLTHTIFYDKVHLSSLKDKEPEEILNMILNFEYQNPPGEKYAYTNTNAVLLGMIIEKLSGRCLGEYAKETFFKPLGMTRTSFNTGIHDKSEIVPTEFDKWRGRLIQGEVHDESAWKIGKKQFVGSAGLFTTVPDLLIFLEMLISGGEYKGIRYFKPNTVEMMHTNQIGHLGRNHGLGWELYQRRYMGTRAGPNTFGKTGFTGCVVVCDVKRKMGMVLLSNYIHPSRKGKTWEDLNELRRDIADIVFESV
jgi:CubicO group peptidase (beta-lactamase class C family)